MKINTQYSYIFLWLAFAIVATADHLTGGGVSLENKQQQQQQGSLTSGVNVAKSSEGPESRQSFGPASSYSSSLGALPSTGYLQWNGPTNTGLGSSGSGSANSYKLISTNGNFGSELLPNQLAVSSLIGQNPQAGSSSTNALLSMLRPQAQQGQQRRSSLTNRLKNLVNALFWRESSSTPYLASDSSYSFTLKQPPMSFQNQFGASGSSGFGNLASGSAYQPVVIQGQANGNGPSGGNWAQSAPSSGSQKNFQWQSAPSSQGYWQSHNGPSQLNSYQQPSYAASNPLAVYQPQSGALTAASSNVQVSSGQPNLNQPQLTTGQQVNSQQTPQASQNVYANQYQRSGSAHGSQFKPVSSGALFSATNTLNNLQQTATGSASSLDNSNKPVAASYQL